MKEDICKQVDYFLSSSGYNTKEMYKIQGKRVFVNALINDKLVRMELVYDEKGRCSKVKMVPEDEQDSE